MARASGGAAPDALAHGVAHDARGPAARRLTPSRPPSLPLDGGSAERCAARRQAGQGHHVVAARPAGAAEASSPTARRSSRTASASACTSPTARVNLYQLRQWYTPLVELAKRHPVLILSRASGSALAAARRVAPARRVRAARRRPRAGDPRAGPARRVLREPERQELPDDALRAPLARVHQPRRVRQDVHDHEPVQGLRLRVHRGRCGAGAAREGALGLRLRQARHPHRASAGRSLPRRVAAAVHARRPRGGALRADLGGRPRRRRLRLDRVARRRARARAARHRAPPRHLPAAPALGRGRPRLRCGESRRSSRRSPPRTPPTRRRSTSSTTARRSAGSSRRRMSRSSTSRRWSTTASPPASRCSSRVRRTPRRRSTRAATCRRASGSTRSDAATMVARVDEVAHDADALARLGVWVERYFGDTTPGRHDGAVPRGDRPPHGRVGAVRGAARGRREVDEHDVEADADDDADAAG